MRTKLGNLNLHSNYYYNNYYYMHTYIGGGIVTWWTTCTPTGGTMPSVGAQMAGFDRRATCSKPGVVPRKWPRGTMVAPRRSTCRHASNPTMMCSKVVPRSTNSSLPPPLSCPNMLRAAHHPSLPLQPSLALCNNAQVPYLELTSFVASALDLIADMNPTISPSITNELTR